MVRAWSPNEGFEPLLRPYRGVSELGYGYYDKLLRVNLTSGSVKEEELPDIFYCSYIGGRNVIAHFRARWLVPK